jgi:multicomponent Na+:H+ antiporter subunit C
MQLWHALMIGLIFGCAVYLILQNSFVKVLFGFGLLSHGANLFVLAMTAQSDLNIPPIITEAGGVYADPLPQALILTAIVIGFAVTAYLTILLYRLFLDYKTTEISKVFQSESGENT